MKRFLLLLVVFVVGCSGSGRTFNLDEIQSKVSQGMSEVQATSAIGAPSSISMDGETRKLKYDGKDGGYLELSVQQARVIGVDRH